MSGLTQVYRWLHGIVERPHVRFLRRIGAGHVPHSGTTLLAHLRGTETLLRRFGLREELCSAGLFHSVYGTERFPDAVISVRDRDSVRSRIGAEAESLVFTWHVVERRSLAQRLAPPATARRRDGEPLPLSDSEFRDIVDLMIADALEHLPRGDEASRERQRTWLTPFLPLASASAAAAARAFFAGR